MKTRHIKKVFFLLTTLVLYIQGFTQITAQHLQTFITAGKYSDGSSIKNLDEIKQFYSKLHFSTTWIEEKDIPKRDILFATLSLSLCFGLNEGDYLSGYIQSLRTGRIVLSNINDSVEAEMRLTEAALHFYNDYTYGNCMPFFGYNGLSYVPRCRNIASILADHLLGNQLESLRSKLLVPLPEIIAISNKLAWFNKIIKQSNFAETIVTSNKATVGNLPLILKLNQLGIIDSVNSSLTEGSLKQKIKEAQRQFDLLADGVIRPTLLQQLNVPVSVRIQQLNLSINYYRWLYCLTQVQAVIVVNIPAAYLKVYHNNKVLLDMRLIVGKPSTPTPTLASTVSEVVLYPYWHVPYSIATKEMLPHIKKNAEYIDAGNYQVLNRAGKIMNPYSINWQTLSTKNFPYIIRQSTGCDNALGLLKLNFYNPSGVYLHDTPVKGLFLMNKRYFSHGCMRMEKPMELGHLVLYKNKIAIDTLEQKGCLRNQSPIIVPASEHMPVIVWYNPTGVDDAGHLVFYEDVYKKFGWMKNSDITAGVVHNL